MRRPRPVAVVGFVLLRLQMLVFQLGSNRRAINIAVNSDGAAAAAAAAAKSPNAALLADSCHIALVI